MGSQPAPDHYDIFISYARDDDEPFATRLWHNLTNHGFKVWWDREAMESRGLSFLREIRDAISSVERVLLIVGPRVRHKPYVEVEWRQALREGVVVTPLLRLGDYGDVPDALKALHCEDVRPTVAEEAALARVRRIAATPVPSLGPVIGVPRLPTPYLERPHALDHLRGRVLIDAYAPIDLQPDQRITCLTGMGGVGKSVIAAALAQAPDVRRSFPDGLYWIAVGRDADTLRTLTRVGLAVGDDVNRYTGIAEARLLLERALVEKNCLVVLDDLWEVDVAEALHTAAGRNVRILLTSRKRRLFASAGVHELAVDELTAAEALDLLARWTDTTVPELPSEAVEIVGECGNLPLAVAMIGATIRGRPDRWVYALNRLRQADLSKIRQKLPDYSYESLERAMLVSFQDLGEQRQRTYCDLVAVPEDVAAPGEMLRAWWMYEGMDDLDITDVLDDLVDRSLLRLREDGAYILHDVQRDFLIMHTQDERALHLRWLRAFAPPAPEGWAAATDHNYLLDQLGYHLSKAGKEDDWRALQVSFDWLNRKTAARGFPAVLLDIKRYSADLEIGVLYRACRRAAHIVTNDPTQLGAQLLARLDSAIQPNSLSELLRQARASSSGLWLCPKNASLSDIGEPMLLVFRGREADGHQGTPRSIAVSADGTKIASGGGSSNDLTVKIWSAAAATLLRTYGYALDAGGSIALAFVTSERLAAATGDELRLYSLDAAEPVAQRKFGGVGVSHICADDRFGVVFAGFKDGRVVAWNPGNDTIVDLRKADDDAIVAVAHATASPRLAIATGSGVECRDSQEGHLIGRLEEISGNSSLQWQPPALSILPNGSRVFFGNPPRSWIVDEVQSRSLVRDLDLTPAVAIAADGSAVVTTPNGRELLAIETAGGRRIGRVRNSREFSCLALIPDRGVVATGDFEHDVKLWDMTRAETEAPAWESRGAVRSVAICDGTGPGVIVTDETRELWDIVSGAPIGNWGQVDINKLVRHRQPLFDSTIRQQIRASIETALGKEEGDMGYRLEEPVGVLAFSQTANRAVSAFGYRAKFADMEEPPSDPSRARFPLYVWDVNSVSEARLLRGHTMPISCVDLTSDGKLALTGSRGRLLRLWDLETGTCLKILSGHRGGVYDCALMDGARLAVSGSEDMTLRLWDLVEGKLLFTFACSSAVAACDIARDGSAVIAGEVSGRVHTFSVAN